MTAASRGDAAVTALSEPDDAFEVERFRLNDEVAAVSPGTANSDSVFGEPSSHGSPTLSFSREANPSLTGFDHSAGPDA